MITVYVGTTRNRTIASTCYEDACLPGCYGGYYRPKEMKLPDDCAGLYRVYCYDLSIDEYVKTLEEAKAIIKQYHGQQRRKIRRWYIPIEGTLQLSLF